MSTVWFMLAIMLALFVILIAEVDGVVNRTLHPANRLMAAICVGCLVYCLIRLFIG